MSEKSKQFRIFLKEQKAKGKVKDIQTFPTIFTEPETFIKNYKEILRNTSVNKHETTIKLIEDYFLAMENFLRENNYNNFNLLKTHLIEFLSLSFDLILSAKDVMMIFINLAKSKKFEILFDIVKVFNEKNFKYVNFSEMVTSDSTQDLVTVLSENSKNEFVNQIFELLSRNPTLSKRVEAAIHQSESAIILEKLHNFLKLKNHKTSDLEFVEKVIGQMNSMDINEFLFHHNNGFNFINFLMDLKNKPGVKIDSARLSSCVLLIINYIKNLEIENELKSSYFFNRGENILIKSVISGDLELVELIMKNVKEYINLTSNNILKKINSYFRLSHRFLKRDNIFHHVFNLNTNRVEMFILVKNFLNEIDIKSETKSMENSFKLVDFLMNEPNIQGELPINILLQNFNEKECDIILENITFNSEEQNNPHLIYVDLNRVFQKFVSSRNLKIGKLSLFTHPSFSIFSNDNEKKMKKYNNIIKYLHRKNLFNPFCYSLNNQVRNPQPLLNLINKKLKGSLDDESIEIIFYYIFKSENYYIYIDHGFFDFYLFEILEFINNFAPNKADFYCEKIIQILEITDNIIQKSRKEIFEIKLCKKNSFYFKKYLMFNKRNIVFQNILKPNSIKKKNLIDFTENQKYVEHSSLATFASNLKSKEKLSFYVSILFSYSKNLDILISLLSKSLSDTQFSYLFNEIKNQEIFRNYIIGKENNLINLNLMSYNFSLSKNLNIILSIFDLIKNVELITQFLPNIFKRLPDSNLKSKTRQYNLMNQVFRFFVYLFYLPLEVRDTFFNLICNFLALIEEFNPDLNLKIDREVFRKNFLFKYKLLEKSDWVETIFKIFRELIYSCDYLYCLHKPMKILLTIYSNSVINTKIVKKNLPFYLNNLVSNVVPLLLKEKKEGESSLTIDDRKTLLKNFIFTVPKICNKLGSSRSKLNKITSLQILFNEYSNNFNFLSYNDLDMVLNFLNLAQSRILVENNDYSVDKQSSLFNILEFFSLENKEIKQKYFSFLPLNYVIPKYLADHSLINNLLNEECPDLLSFNLFSSITNPSFDEQDMKNLIQLFKIIKNQNIQCLKTKSESNYTQIEKAKLIKNIYEKTNVGTFLNNFENMHKFMNNSEQYKFDLNEFINHKGLCESLASAFYYICINNWNSILKNPIAHKLLNLRDSLPNLFSTYSGYNLRFFNILIEIFASINSNIDISSNLLKIPKQPNYSYLKDFITLIYFILNSLLKNKEEKYLDIFISSLMEIDNSKKLLSQVINKYTYIKRILSLYFVYKDDFKNFFQLQEICENKIEIQSEVLQIYDNSKDLGWINIKLQKNNFSKFLYQNNNYCLYFVSMMNYQKSKNILQKFKSKLPYQYIISEYMKWKNQDSNQNNIPSYLKILKSTIMKCGNIEFILEFSEIFDFTSHSEYSNLVENYKNLTFKTISVFQEYFPDFEPSHIFLAALESDYYNIAKEIFIYCPNQKTLIQKVFELSGSLYIFVYLTTKDEYEFLESILNLFEKDDPVLLSNIKTVEENLDEYENDLNYYNLDDALVSSIRSKSFYSSLILIPYYSKEEIFKIFERHLLPIWDSFILEFFQKFHTCGKFQNFLKNKFPDKNKNIPLLRQFKEESLVDNKKFANPKTFWQKKFEFMIFIGVDYLTYWELEAISLLSRDDILKHLTIFLSVLKIPPKDIPKLLMKEKNFNETFWIYFFYILSSNFNWKVIDVNSYLDSNNTYADYLSQNKYNKFAIETKPEFDEFLLTLGGSIEEEIYPIFLNLCKNNSKTLINILYMKYHEKISSHILSLEKIERYECFNLEEFFRSDFYLLNQAINRSSSEHWIEYTFKTESNSPGFNEREKKLSYKLQQVNFINIQYDDPILKHLLINENNILSEEHVEVFALNNSLIILLDFVFYNTHFLKNLTENIFKSDLSFYNMLYEYSKVFYNLQKNFIKLTSKESGPGLKNLLHKTHINTHSHMHPKLFYSNTRDFIREFIRVFPKKNVNYSFFEETFEEFMKSLEVYEENLYSLAHKDKVFKLVEILQICQKFDEYIQFVINQMLNIEFEIRNVKENFDEKITRVFKLHVKNSSNVTFSKEMKLATKRWRQDALNFMDNIKVCLFKCRENQEELYNLNADTISHGIYTLALNRKYDNFNNTVNSLSSVPSIKLDIPYNYDSKNKQIKTVFGNDKPIDEFLIMIYKNIQFMLEQTFPNEVNNLYLNPFFLYPEFFYDRLNINNDLQINQNYKEKLKNIRNKFIINIPNDFLALKFSNLFDILDGEPRNGSLSQFYPSDLYRNLQDSNEVMELFNLEYENYMSNLDNYKIKTLKQIMRGILYKENLDLTQIDYLNFMTKETNYEMEIFLEDLRMKSCHLLHINRFNDDGRVSIHPNYESIKKIIEAYEKFSLASLINMKTPEKECVKKPDFIKILKGLTEDKRKILKTNSDLPFNVNNENLAKVFKLKLIKCFYEEENSFNYLFVDVQDQLRNTLQKIGSKDLNLKVQIEFLLSDDISNKNHAFKNSLINLNSEANKYSTNFSMFDYCFNLEKIEFNWDSLDLLLNEKTGTIKLNVFMSFNNLISNESQNDFWFYFLLNLIKDNAYSLNQQYIQEFQHLPLDLKDFEIFLKSKLY